MLHLKARLAAGLAIVVAAGWGCGRGQPPATETAAPVAVVPITTGSEQALEAYLAGRGLRLTRPRRTVLEAVMAQDRHFGPAEIERRAASAGVHRA
ncbi:MAG TPA: hypothetical protein PLV66_15460, partial [Thermoanaerobaculales bacterium]|nr:hypothetical protein [Thermoanaerobaculales bacterium]